MSHPQANRIGILYLNTAITIDGRARQSVAAAEARFKVLPGIGVAISPRSGAPSMLVPWAAVQGADLADADAPEDKLPRPPGPPAAPDAPQKSDPQLTEHAILAESARREREKLAAARNPQPAPRAGRISVDAHGRYYRAPAASDSTTEPAAQPSTEGAPEAAAPVQAPEGAATAEQPAPSTAARGAPLNVPAPPPGMVYRDGRYERENPTPPVVVEGDAQGPEDEAVTDYKPRGRRKGPAPSRGDA